MTDKHTGKPLARHPGDSAGWIAWAALLALSVALVAMLAGQPAPTQAQVPLAISVQKYVDHTAILPGHTPAPLYTVTFSNPYTTAMVLDAITDTLPAGFIFSGMHGSSDWLEEPDDAIEPAIVWQGPITVPATDTLSLVYAVYVPGSVPRSPVPYYNQVIAAAGSQLIGPAAAPLIVGAPEFDADKTAWPLRVLSGELVTYTVHLANSGEVTGTVAVITDTLDPSLTFAAMASGSDVTEPPQQAGSMLTWSGPFTVAVGDALQLSYQVSTTLEPGWSRPCNRVTAWAGDATAGPAIACVQAGPEKASIYLPIVYKQVKWAHFTIAKTAYPTTVMAGFDQVVTNALTIANDGDHPGTIGSLYDVLPAGFTYLHMAPASDITTNPSGTTGTITWARQIQMAPDQQIHVIYVVAPSATPGSYSNLAGVNPLAGARAAAPASAIVTVEPGILLEDNFDDGIGQWTEFLNYKYRLAPGQWYWGPADGINGSGALSHDALRVPGKVAADALMMYLQEGAQDWANYRVETKMYLTGGVTAGGQLDPKDGLPIGLWVRGHYQESDINAQWVTGYYIIAKSSDDPAVHWVRLAQPQIPDDCTTACDNPNTQYAFNNVKVLCDWYQTGCGTAFSGEYDHFRWYTLTVEVRGNNIKAWLDGELAFDYTDDNQPFMTGTVGFKVHETKIASFDDVIVTQLP